MQKNKPATEKVIEKDGRRYREVVKKSALPIWGAAAVWILAALFLPMHTLPCILIAAGVSLLTGLVLAKVLPKETEWEELPFTTGNTDLDNVVQKTAELLAVLRHAAEAAPDPEIDARLTSIAGSIEKIRDALVADPRDLPVVRRFISYYLPTTEKLLHKYVFVLQQGTDSQNIRETKTAIEGVLVQLDTAYRHQLDALFADDALDVTTDIAVLEALLTRDNLQ